MSAVPAAPGVEVGDAPLPHAMATGRASRVAAVTRNINMRGIISSVLMSAVAPGWLRLCLNNLSWCRRFGVLPLKVRVWEVHTILRSPVLGSNFSHRCDALVTEPLGPILNPAIFRFPRTPSDRSKKHFIVV